MKVILTQDVENLGLLGDTIEVKPGYGRNYLIPHGVALLATGKASKELRHVFNTLKNCVKEKLHLHLNKPRNLKHLNWKLLEKLVREGGCLVL